jgi:CheY-like chemotaxis protein
MDIEKMLRRVLGEDVELRLALPAEALPVMADSGQLGQLLVNLATNARDAMPDGGTFTLATRECGPPPGLSGRWAELTATDTGTGIDPEVASHIFEPFFTTKEVGKGTGLGLAIVHGIVAQHRGIVDVLCPPDGGSAFRVLLPLADGQDDGLPPPAAEGHPSRGEGTILLAEDEPEVRRVIRLTLEEAGYRVLEAADGREAIGRLGSGGAAVDLLVSDVVMPGMNGLELVERARTIVPGLPALLMSGYSAELVDRKGALPENVRLLSKPASPDAILRAVAALVPAAGAH